MIARALLLRKAAFYGNLSQLKKLYKEFKLNINEPGANTLRTVLHQGVLGGHPDILSWVLKGTEAEVDSRDIDGNTPLNLAAQVYKVALLKKLLMMDLLLAHGADCTLVNNEDRSPLMNVLPLRHQIAASCPNQRQGMGRIIHRMKKGIYEKAEALKRSVSISPNGQVIFNKTTVPHLEPVQFNIQVSSPIALRHFHQPVEARSPIDLRPCEERSVIDLRR